MRLRSAKTWTNVDKIGIVEMIYNREPEETSEQFFDKLKAAAEILNGRASWNGACRDSAYLFVEVNIEEASRLWLEC